MDQFGEGRGAIPKRNRPFPFHREVGKAVEWRFGIGGEMVLARERQAVAGRPHGTGAKNKKVSPGTAKMKAAAGKTVADHSDEIAKSLLESLRKGDVNSAKLLFALAEGQIDLEDEEVMQRLCSYAEKLASEPEWKGEVLEG